MSDDTTSPSPNTDSTANDQRVRDILDRVAAGELSSEEAARLLAQKPAEPRHAAPSSNVWEAVADPITPQPPPPTTPSDVSGSDTAAPAASSDEGGPAGPSEEAAAASSATPSDESGTAPAAASYESAPAGPSEEAVAASSATPSGAAPAAASDEGGPAGPSEEAAGRGDGGVDGGAGPGGVRGVDEEDEEVHADVPVPAGVQRVVVRAIGRRVRIVGEPAVTGVAVDGPHAIKREGDTLSINSDGEMGVSIDGLSMLRTRSVGDLKSNVVGGLAKELSIRVNPRLAVEVEVTAGTVSVERVPALSKVRVTAGSAKVTDVDGPIDFLVQAGSGTLDAQLTKGKSRVRVESGSATVKLRRGSDVRVHSEAQLGRVTWTGAVNGPSRDVEIGRGRASLDVEVLIGTAQIASD